MNINKKFGFTLAEVLITLAIIGVITVLTVPTLMENIQEKMTVAKVKKVYIALNQSYMKARLKYGPLSEWGASASRIVCDEHGTCTHYPSDQVYTAMAKLLYSIKSSFNENNIIYHMYLGSNTKFSDKQPFTINSIITTTGLGITNPDCNTTRHGIKNFCGDFRVDINGVKGPNTLGKDVFDFYITKNTIVPDGQREDGLRPLSTYCDKDSNIEYNGYGCTAWVIEKGNMDYLHRHVSWDE